MTSLEERLASWTGPSSDSEKERQELAERMVREAIRGHEGFSNCGLQVFAKGSYANNTNVKSDSDIDIAVKCTDVTYWGESSDGAHPPGAPYGGPWTPSKLRAELIAAMQATFPGQVDTSGSMAIHVDATNSRVDIDVVPCFDYKYYLSHASWRDGSKVFKKDGSSLVNYPDQQLANGIAKNNATGRSYKRTVRILKRLENAMVSAGYHREVPSFFVECLVYNVPNSILNRSSWSETVKGALYHIWSELDGIEPTDDGLRWLEVNEYKYLFHSTQPWPRKDGRDFAYAGWNFLELGT